MLSDDRSIAGNSLNPSWGAGLLAADFDDTEFIAANLTDMNSIDIERSIKKVKILSPHNTNTYQLTKKDDQSTVLEIVNPEEFWKIKYLVIIANS